jgi:hypothetical protein
MTSGRTKIKLKVGFYYTTDNGTILYVLKKFKTLKFPFLVIDTQGNLYRYTEKGRFVNTFQNHPMNVRKEYLNGKKQLFRGNS